MKTGALHARGGHSIDYKALRKINPEAARRAGLEYLGSCQHNVSATARAFGITRVVVYAILRKQQAGDLRDGSKEPKRQPSKTSAKVEDQVIAAKNKTRFGPQRLSLYLAKYEGLPVSYGTIRHILRRNPHRLTYPTPAQSRRKEPRPSVD